MQFLVVIVFVQSFWKFSIHNTKMLIEFTKEKATNWDNLSFLNVHVNLNLKATSHTQDD